ncbi:MAG: DUF3551 domain-containing protein [Hyphomonadaceae bacterium]|nr:DUF3551 domain-containing protein [Hyphomonadaceae bacterium]
MRCILLAIALATIAAVAFATTAQAEGSAPFCTVDAAGTHCHYYGMDACRAAAGPSGVCVVNQQSQNSDRRGFDFTPRNDVLSEAQRWRDAAPPAPNSSTSRQQRWLRMCDKMEQGYFTDLESIRSRFNPPMTADEYAEAAAQFRRRGEYCRSLAR